MELLLLLLAGWIVYDLKEIFFGTNRIKKIAILFGYRPKLCVNAKIPTKENEKKGKA